MLDLTSVVYAIVTLFSVVGMVLAARLLISLKKHYEQIEEFGSAIGFLKSDKFLQYIQVLSISVLLWLASILSTIGVSLHEGGQLIARMFELLSVITFIVGCYTALNVIEQYESRKKF